MTADLAAGVARPKARRRISVIALIFALLVGLAAGVPTAIALIYAFETATAGTFAALVIVLLLSDAFLVALAALTARQLVRRNHQPSRLFAEAVTAGADTNFESEVPPVVERELQPAMDRVWSIGRNFAEPERVIADVEKQWQHREAELVRVIRHWQRQHAQARGLIDLIAELNQAVGLKAVLEQLATGLSRFFANDAVAIWMCQPDGELGLTIQVAGEFPQVLSGTAPRVQWVLEGNMNVIARGHEADALPSVLLPLRDAQGHSVGIVAVRSLKRTGYSAEDQAFLQMVVGHAALALMNGILYDHTDALSRTDALTGLFNRREFDRILNSEAERARRYNTALTLLMIDIDHFKRINDQRGHPAGDSALQRLVQVIRELPLRANDTAFRLGGEEFAVVLVQTGKSGAAAVAERLRRATEAATFFSDGERVTISIGVASFPEDVQNVAELAACADRALYQAKNGGRNRVQVA